MAGLEVIVQSVQDMIDGWTGSRHDIKIDTLPIAVLCVTIGLKACLYITCRILGCRDVTSSQVETLQDDHRNDVMTNICALGAAIIASRITYLWFFDPIGAILLSLYIVMNWYHNGKSQIAYLIGKSAPSEFISQIVYMAAHFSPEIKIVDTVLAYHYGMKFVVECHIGLPGDMILKKAHDIGEGLETQIEKLDLVEKCFVHLDYEWEHEPEYHRHYKFKRADSKENSRKDLFKDTNDSKEGTPPKQKSKSAHGTPEEEKSFGGLSTSEFATSKLSSKTAEMIKSDVDEAQLLVTSEVPVTGEAQIPKIKSINE
jgi:divalent metal cation (Fe/Co/Zn/Cd) transporter